MNAPCRRRAIWAAQAEVKQAVLQEIKHEKDEARKDADAKTEAMPDVTPYMCPKCKRIYKRGMYFHQKYCRGL